MCFSLKGAFFDFIGFRVFLPESGKRCFYTFGKKGDFRNFPEISGKLDFLGFLEKPCFPVFYPMCRGGVFRKTGFLGEGIPVRGGFGHLEGCPELEFPCPSGWKAVVSGTGGVSFQDQPVSRTGDMTGDSYRLVHPE